MEMKTFVDVEKLMTKLEISYEIVNHPASHSTEESDRYIEGHEGCRSKTLVLVNKKSTEYYMVIMDDAKKIDMALLADLLGGVKRLHFMSEERLQDVFGLTSGIVSQFGLIDTHYDNLHIYFDKKMLEEHKIQTYHPNDNTKTIFFPMEACFKILEAQGYSYEILDLE
ncbi:MAG: prolyl-tRNA synthetase associated domain-containing protein [Streptococcaceae bacterium]|jgi:Ala-tRNA(Pro) deacylase|nr:prolyl-tRNA synthetase associated domain-containing protein [Streptococcaceae bacterium]